MKTYTVAVDTVIEGRPVITGDTVRLSEDKAKVYMSAGLIVDPDAKTGKSASK